MNNEVKICKRCGKEILEGKYCKMCTAERKEQREKNKKLILECVAGLGSLALIVVPKVLRKSK